MMKKITFVLLLSVFNVGLIIAQPPPPGCPPSYSAGFDITGDSVSYCDDGITLTANGFGTLFSTDSYAVNSIPYNPYPWVGSNSILVGQDDIWSGIVPLPFDFCFFGQKYSQIVIGANGQVGFDITQANGANAWASAAWVAPNNNAAMNNTIMAPYHDLDPSVGNTSQITWDVYGTAPCRYMVVSWDSVPMFSCNSLFGAQQVVLFESTYLIDINIKNKPLCSGWNTGAGHQGIQNATGTVAFMVPGRNGTAWSASNDSYRFTPSGTQALSYIFSWIDVPTNTVLFTGNPYTAFPPNNTQITCVAQAVTDCDTIEALLADTIDIIVTGSVTADFDFDIRLGCFNDTVIFTNTSTWDPGLNPTFFWDFDNGTTSVQNSPTVIFGSQGVYDVQLIVDANGCLDTITKTISLVHPIMADFSIGHAGSPPLPADSLCEGSPFNFTSNSTPTSLGSGTHYWDFGDGNTLGPLPNPVGTVIPAYNYASPGSYVVKLVVEDTLGCKDSISKPVFVDEKGFSSMSATPTEVCVGDPVYFSDSSAPFKIRTQYNFGDGTILQDKHNPVYNFTDAGNYNVTFISYYPICDSVEVSETITVNAPPIIDLGPDTEICPDVSPGITIRNEANPAMIMEWSTGESAASITVNDPDRYWASSGDAGCTSTDSIWVKRDCYINIPNAFSPDGDGLNDYFFPRQLLSSGVTVFKMAIFNRWGEKIFLTDNILGRGWDGRYDGILQPMGAYIYHIEVVFKNGAKGDWKGNVTLVR